MPRWSRSKDYFVIRTIPTFLSLRSPARIFYTGLRITIIPMSAAGNVESIHVFKARALQIGLKQPVLDLFSAKGLASFGTFAWSCSYTPGGNDETPFVDMVTRTLTRAPTDEELSVLRRLFFESHAVSLQDMRTRIDKSSDAPPTKIQPAEKAARYADQVVRLVGLQLKGPLEPSYQLIDAVFALVEENSLKYISVQTLTSREQEMLGEKEDTELKEYFLRMKAGTLTAQEKPNPIRADLGTDLKIRFALQRRGLAFDQAALITWSLHDEWVAVLFHRMAETPPSGHYAVSMEQCLRADRRLFLKMSEDCRANINALAGQPRPLDVAMKRFMEHIDVLYLLMHLPMPASAQPKAAVQWEGKGDRTHPYEGGKPKGKGKGSPKGQGKRKGSKGKNQKGKGEFGPPPGCVGKTQDGRNVCFGFNRPGGCSTTGIEAGRSCVRGFHICGRANCHGNHASFDCPNHVQ